VNPWKSGVSTILVFCIVEHSMESVKIPIVETVEIGFIGVFDIV